MTTTEAGKAVSEVESALIGLADIRAFLSRLDVSMFTDKRRLIYAAIDVRALLAQQAAEIERLTALVPKWVACSQELPEDSQHVLVWAPICLCHFTAYQRDGKWFCAHDSAPMEAAFAPSLWRHLPSPPDPVTEGGKHE